MTFNLLQSVLASLRPKWLSQFDDSKNGLPIVALIGRHHRFALVLLFFGVSCIFVLLLCWCIRQATYWRLKKSGLPTVFWRPKFWTYDLLDQPKKLPSSTITNILPRMKTLGGPYGMYGTVYGLSTSVVHVAHPTAALAILQASSNQPKRGQASKSTMSPWMESTGVLKSPAYNHFKNFCGEGVFTADGQDWKTKRAAVIHALLRTQKGGWEAHLEGQISRTARDLVGVLQKHENTVANVVPVLQRSTVGLIYRYITHSELPDTESSATMLSSYLDAVVRIRLIILAQSRSIWFLLPRWVYKMFSSLFHKEEETMVPIRQFALTACESALPGSPLDTLRQNAIYQDSSKNYSDNILYEAITLLFAGQDTSAATLSWTLHLLSLHPEIQERVSEEVRSVAGNCESITKKEVSFMPLLDAVIKESMRLYPVAPFVVRKVTQSTELPERDGKAAVTLPKNSLACIWIYGLHRNEEFWANPDVFEPERWLNDEITAGSFMPFAHGPRNCVGQPLAQIILRSLLAHLLRSFEFQIPPNGARERKDMQVGFTVLPRDGLSLLIQKRTN